MVNDAIGTGGVAGGGIGRGSGKAAPPLSKAATSPELAASLAAFCTGSGVPNDAIRTGGGVGPRVGKSSAAAPHRGDGDTVLARCGDTILAQCGCLRWVDGLGAGDHGCCPAVLDRRSGVLQAGLTAAGEPGSNPTGKNDRSAQGLQIPASALDSSPPSRFRLVQGSTGTMPAQERPKCGHARKKNGRLIKLLARELDGDWQDQGGFAGYGPRVTWVMRGKALTQCPLHPRKRTSTTLSGRSAECQEPTSRQWSGTLGIEPMRPPISRAHFLDLTRFTRTRTAVCYLLGASRSVVFSPGGARWDG